MTKDKARLSHSPVPCNMQQVTPVPGSLSAQGSAHDTVPTHFLALRQTNSNFALKSRHAGMFTDEECSYG